MYFESKLHKTLILRSITQAFLIGGVSWIGVRPTRR